MNIKGILRCYDIERNELLFETNNTIVFIGREQLFPFLTKKINQNTTGNVIDPSTWILGYFSFGSGGLQDQNDPMSKILPSPQDTDLYYPISGFDSILPSVTQDGRYKYASNIDFLQDTTNLNKYLITRFTVILERQEFNGYMLSEAGLYFADSPNAKAATKFSLFAHTTFPGKLKLSQPIAFSWFFYT